MEILLNKGKPEKQKIFFLISSVLVLITRYTRLTRLENHPRCFPLFSIWCLVFLHQCQTYTVAWRRLECVSLWHHKTKKVFSNLIKKFIHFISNHIMCRHGWSLITMGMKKRCVSPYPLTCLMLWRMSSRKLQFNHYHFIAFLSLNLLHLLKKYTKLNKQVFKGISPRPD